MPVLPLEGHLMSEAAGIQEHSLIKIPRIMTLPFLSPMDNLVIACKGVGHPKELGKNAAVELIHTSW